MSKSANATSAHHLSLIHLEANSHYSIAVVIPCHNEALTIYQVVRDAKSAMPNAEVYVFDNCSSDRTTEEAIKAGAHVVKSPILGKGYVMRHAFELINTDILVMVDGDGTYPMASAIELVNAIKEQNIDMAVGGRMGSYVSGAFPAFHLFGNRLLSNIVTSTFNYPISDMLSGYRAFTREFYKLIPLNSKGFEIETDLTLQGIAKGFRILEIPVNYGTRPPGSYSKLKTWQDGLLILRFILKLAQDYRPLPFFFSTSIICFIFGLIAGFAPLTDYIHFAYVYTVPRAILAASLMVLAVVLIGVGLILDSQMRSFNEQFKLMRKIMPRNRELT
jgi:glycosyltransferase involved in cell wall biosynthesis